MSKIKLYNETAATYNRRYRRIQQSKYQALIPFFHDGPLVDVGIGTGIGLALLSNFQPVIGIDGSIEMLRIAQRQILADKDYQRRVSVLCALSTALPFRNQIFSGVLCITVIQNLANPKKGVKELIRVSQHRGLVGITALERKMSLQEIKSFVAYQAKTITNFANLANEDVGVIIKRR